LKIIFFGGYCYIKLFLEGRRVNFLFHNIFYGVQTLHVKVRFFTSLREILNKREETLTLPDNKLITFNVVLKNLSEKYGDLFVEYVYKNNSEKPKNFLQFLVNGTSTSTLNGLETEIKNGDVLAILPPVGGG